LGFAAVGVLAAVLLVFHYHVPALGGALSAVGGIGLAAVVAVNFVPIFLCSAAWRVLLMGRTTLPTFVWFRYTRDAAGDLLGFIPAAGELAALREMIRCGLERRLAVPVLIADVTIQMIAQLVFTATGVTVLFIISPTGLLMRAALIGLLALVALLVAVIYVQWCGVGRILGAFARRTLPDALRGDPAILAEFDARLRDTYADHGRVAAATTLHIAAWFIGIAEAGLALSLMGAWPGLDAVLVIESLIFALRTAAFFVPGALGVQEVAYVMLGSVFGLAPEIMLALALVKRARELMVGVPVLIIGQILSAFRLSAGNQFAPASDRLSAEHEATPLPG
jgi:putative membrane protein